MRKNYRYINTEKSKPNRTKIYFLEPKSIEAEERLKSYLNGSTPKIATLQDDRFKNHAVYQIQKGCLLDFIKAFDNQEDYKIFKKQKTPYVITSADSEISKELV